MFVNSKQLVVTPASSFESPVLITTPDPIAPATITPIKKKIVKTKKKTINTLYTCISPSGTKKNPSSSNKCKSGYTLTTSK